MNLTFWRYSIFNKDRDRGRDLQDSKVAELDQAVIRSGVLKIKEEV
jgi:hypothetical protein